MTIVESIMICTSHKILFRLSNQEELDGQGMWHIWGEEGVCAGFGGETREKGTICNTEA